MWTDFSARPVPGTGPYAIESFVPDRQVKLVRNPHFRVWSEAARPAANPDEIVFRIETDHVQASRSGRGADCRDRSSYRKDPSHGRVALLNR